MEVLSIKPEQVEFFRFADFKMHYARYVEVYGVNRDGTPPAYKWTVRPGLEIHVEGYDVGSEGGSV